MGRIRSKFSPKSKYYIGRHAFLTTYYYCLNYPGWKRLHDSMVGLHRSGDDGPRGGSGDPTASQAIRLADLAEKIEMIRQTAYAAEPSLHPYLLRYVTEEDMTFDRLKALGIPCEKKMFYDRRRKFYYLMSKQLNL